MLDSGAASLASKNVHHSKFFFLANVIFISVYCIAKADSPPTNVLGLVLQGPNSALSYDKTQTWSAQTCYPPSFNHRIRCEEKTDTWRLTGKCTAELERKERLWWQDSNTPATSNFVWMDRHIDLSKAASLMAVLADKGDHEMMLRFSGEKGVDCWSSNSAYGSQVSKPSSLNCFQSGVLFKRDFPSTYVASDADKVNKAIAVLQEKFCKPIHIAAPPDAGQNAGIQACLHDRAGSFVQCQCADMLFQKNFGPKGYTILMLGIEKKTAEQQAAYQKLTPSEAFNFGMGTSMMFGSANRQCGTHFPSIQSQSLFR